MAAKDELELLELEEALLCAGIPHKAIREPDAPYHGALMAIGIVPMVRKPLRKLLGKFPLMR